MIRKPFSFLRPARAACAVLLLAGPLAAASAWAGGVHWSVSVGVPAPVYAAPVYGAPVYGAPAYGAPVYGAPVYRAAPAYPYGPPPSVWVPPVVYAPAPVYYGPPRWRGGPPPGYWHHGHGRGW